MQDEEIDIRIKEAADQHHPSYDDKAWEKMRLLLDKHLPQEKERRKWIYFLLLFLLLGGATTLVILKPWRNNSVIVAESNNSNVKKEGNDLQQSQQKDGPTNTTTVTPVNGNNAADISSTTATTPQQTELSTQKIASHDITTVTPLKVNNTLNKTVGPAITPKKINTSRQKTAPTLIADNNKNAMPVNTTIVAPVKEKNTINKPVSLAIKNKKTNSLPVSATPLVNSNKKHKPANDKVIASSLNSKNNSTAKIKAADRKTILQSRGRFATKIQSPGTENDNSETTLAAQKNKKTTDKTEDIVSTTPNSDNTNELSSKTVATVPVTSTDNTIAATAKTDSAKDKKTVAVEKINDTALTARSKDKKKPKKGFGNNFGITLSGGADLSYVSLGNPGKATFIYGAGLSYTFAKRFTVRSGFYIDHKIYSATPAEYNGTTYPNLNKISGDCKVYEIPLSLSYNFWQRKNHNWFGSAGISSFLMKKEDYNYEYKTPTGYYYYYSSTVNNKNKHYFSVLTLSAGYQYNLNNRFSLMAEPYVKLPLTGVGAGKIKLNSMGVLLTLTIKPFAKRK